MWHHRHDVWYRALVGVSALSCLAGCAGVPTVDAPSQAELRTVLQTPAMVTPDLLNEPAADLLRLSPDMRRLVNRVPFNGSERERLQSLFDLFKQHNDYYIHFDPEVTLTAEQTFHQRRGNCLSFSALFIAVARAAGLNAHFQEVQTPPNWDALTPDVLVQYQHIDVNVELDRGPPGIIDFRIDRYSRSYPQTVISDKTALGHYYSNLGMNYLVSEDLGRAYVALQRALQAAPRKSFIWNNMGVIQGRLGNRAAAEISYRQALTVNPRELPAISNLARIYEENGQPRLASRLRDYGLRIKLRNPYFRYALAQHAYQNGDYDEAVHQLDVVLRRFNDDDRFYFLRGRALWELGESQSAITDVHQAIRKAAGPESVKLYRQQLAEWAVSEAP